MTATKRNFTTEVTRQFLLDGNDIFYDGKRFYDGNINTGGADNGGGDNIKHDGRHSGAKKFYDDKFYDDEDDGEQKCCDNESISYDGDGDLEATLADTAKNSTASPEYDDEKVYDGAADFSNGEGVQQFCNDNSKFSDDGNEEIILDGAGKVYKEEKLLFDGKLYDSDGNGNLTKMSPSKEERTRERRENISLY